MIEGLRLAILFALRDVVRFAAQPTRVAAAVGTPVILWVFLGSGVGESFRPANLETSYAAFLAPGICTLVAVFTAIFSAIAVIDDRNEGWLRAVLVSPAPRWSIALGRTPVSYTHLTLPTRS